MKCENTRKQESEVRNTNKNKAKKDRIMASRHEKIGKKKAKGMTREKTTANEKENSWLKEHEVRAGRGAARNTNESLTSPGCELQAKTSTQAPAADGGGRSSSEESKDH
jgi:hypothetical protein